MCWITNYTHPEPDADLETEGLEVKVWTDEEKAELLQRMQELVKPQP